MSFLFFLFTLVKGGEKKVIYGLDTHEVMMDPIR